MSTTTIQPPDKLDPGSIDNEHRIQTGLLNALYDAVSDKKTIAEINEILDQLTSYSELHFMSEELLMRLYAYPDYEDHVSDHEAITAYLKGIANRVAAGQGGMALETAGEMREFLISHINTRDEAFAEFLNKVQG